jgi:calcium/calmodulin-dependent protein kinase I
MATIPDLVRVSKLDTQFCSNPDYTQHTQYVSGSTFRQRKIPKEERWEKDKRLGRGSYGVVWLERCIYGDSEGKVRAVKKVRKVESSGYYRELEAIALFSHSKVSHFSPIVFYTALSANCCLV